MRISIKIKFSIFLAVLLLLTVVIISALVLEGIKKNQQDQYEVLFAQQAQTANIYFKQMLLSEDHKVPQTFLSQKGREFAAQLELISGQSVVLYDNGGTALNRNTASPFSEGITSTLRFALNNKTAFLVEKDTLYYMAPLRVGGEQIGVVQFNYSLAENTAFYNGIKQLFVYIGSGVFVFSFILAYFYFDSFANSIIRLKRTVNQIREGSFDNEVLKRRDEIGELSEGIHAMSITISDTLRAMEEERRKLTLAVEKLSMLDQRQKQFIGNVTHEFKTPLTSIKAYLDLLDMYPDDNKLLETAKDTIGGETGRLYEMVEKVLQLSALEKYAFEFSREKVDVRGAVLAVLDGLQGKISKFGLTLNTELSEMHAWADRDSLTLVLVNLLDNAIKYNKPGGLISVRNGGLDGIVWIEVSDSGIGIPEELADKVFEPFYTVDKNRARENGGAGLGLSLARQHAEAQGGNVELVQTGSGGTVFRITLPAYNESAP
ncbi:sensor histidine kinase [Paenibacillus sp. CAU 1782]